MAQKAIFITGGGSGIGRAVARQQPTGEPGWQVLGLRRPCEFVEVLIVAILLAALSWFAFVWGLNLQFQVWPTFITG